MREVLSAIPEGVYESYPNQMMHIKIYLYSIESTSDLFCYITACPNGIFHMFTPCPRFPTKICNGQAECPFVVL